jgi:hypothetical protein
VCLLIGIHLLSESHSFIWTFFPKINDAMVEPWLKPNFHLIDEKGKIIKLSFHWVYKMLMDNFYDIVLLYMICRIAKQLSYPLFLAAFIFMIYRVVDLFLLAWNYKETAEIYIFLAIASVATAIIVLLTKYKKLHIVK